MQDVSGKIGKKKVRQIDVYVCRVLQGKIVYSLAKNLREV